MSLWVEYTTKTTEPKKNRIKSNSFIMHNNCNIESMTAFTSKIITTISTKTKPRITQNTTTTTSTTTTTTITPIMVTTITTPMTAMSAASITVTTIIPNTAISLTGTTTSTIHRFHLDMTYSHIDLSLLLY